jgi:hypothetical protein
MNKPYTPLYSLRWTQTYNTGMTPWDGGRIVAEMEQLKADLVERLVEQSDLTLAKSVIERVKKPRC